MATTCSRHLWSSLFVAIIFSGTMMSSKNQAKAQICGVDLSTLMSKCEKYVKKDGPQIVPSEECCAVVRHINIPCICRYVNPQVLNVISGDKTLYVGRSCGKFVRPGYKCGSYTVPPS